MDTLIRKQETLSGYINRVWTNLLKLGHAKINEHEITTRLERLDDYWKQFQDRHFTLLEHEGLDVTEYARQDVFTSTEDSYFEVRSKLLSALSLRRSTGKPGDATATTASPSYKQMQLPKQNLPTFSGDPLEWKKFRDLFKSLVHDVPDISPVQKLQYLKGCLTGEAADVVSDVPLEDDAYPGAWDDLGKRYDNQRLLHYVHMCSLLACPSASKSSATEIKRLLSVMTRSIRAFRSLKRPVEHWDDWFVHLLVSKLDAQTRLHWETSLADNRSFPTYLELQDCLEERIRALEAANPETLLSRTTSASTTKNAKGSRVSANTASTAKAKPNGKCLLCQESHALPYCAKFKAMNVAQRGDQVKKFGACLNCLRAGHRADACTTTGRCLVCAGKHHTALHGYKLKPAAGQDPGEVKEVAPSTSAEALSSRVSSLASSATSAVLLATAQVILQTESGHSIQVRALLDSGSEATFVTERVAQQLRAKRKRVSVTVSGLQGTQTGAVSSSFSVAVRSRINPSLHIFTEALVLRTLTNLLPAKQGASSSWTYLQGLPLADEAFDVPAKVDAILGADIYGRVLEPGIYRGPPGSPTAQLTAFGWVLTGALASEGQGRTTSHRVLVHHAQPVDDLTMAVQRFWEMEETTSQLLQTPEEIWVEQHFAMTHGRDHTGRYVVRLPRKQEGDATLGASRNAALSRLLSSERRLGSQAELRKRYTDFMVEYLALGHMDPVGPEESLPRDSYYLPHHAVFKTGDQSGKIRVVFNASCRTTSGLSLNECLLPGPKLQSDLWLILTRWRLFRIGFMADIIKMFRQIRIHPEDADLQRILWRADPSEGVRDFRLTTVTYGTSPAPFLALRTLRQLAQDESSRFPLGAEAVTQHSYVDDILAGGDSTEQASNVQEQLISLLRAGGFALSKWASNWTGLCPRSDQQERLLPAGETVGALGVTWDPQSDTLALRVDALGDRSHIAILTKRMALSEVAKLFDPLGWAAPVLVFAKVFIQDLWLTGCDWDDPLPEELVQVWQRFRSSLRQLNEVQLPRWIHFTPNTAAELHGFSDASQRAYAAVTYLRVAEPDGRTRAHLLIARTRVAPMKTQSIPRLELCGALLLARLLHRLAKDLGINPSCVYAWTDAQVVLSWIHSHASRWKPFVANRVAEIQGLWPGHHWNHVRAASNPADAATRGIPPADLLNWELWWHGPAWLSQSRDSWPTKEETPAMDSSEEERRTAVHAVRIPPEDEILERFSSFSRLLRVTAYCFRFINALRREPVNGDFLTSAELRASQMRWIRLVQTQEFSKELAALRTGRCLPAKSPLRGLHPILDDSGLLRVGGRLQSASLPYNERHPLLLPKTGHFTLLLIRHAHAVTLHGGPQLIRSYLLRQFWILGGASRVRQVARQCIRCVRFKAKLAEQKMGQLPPERVQPARPFQSSGVDYAGPLRVRTSKGRGHTSSKAAFRRFTSRRGRCALLWSDNGTNFRGADAELRNIFRAASEFYKEIGAYLANDGTTWRFIPPHAPHFGGLWEAGVRSAKYHLRRLLGDHALTFEELSTVLCQIEACLNLRPLGPLSSDPHDLVALTPGHFLVGEPLSNLPEPQPSNPPSSLRQRWNLITNIKLHFWQRWAKEYLHRLQQSTKWHHQRVNVKVGDLVLVKDELLPPAKWPLGRIVAVHPGPDGLVRVATVKTATATRSRPITRLCPLPADVVDTPIRPPDPVDAAPDAP